LRIWSRIGYKEQGVRRKPIPVLRTRGAGKVPGRVPGIKKRQAAMVLFVATTVEVRDILGWMHDTPAMDAMAEVHPERRGR
jgi:hypothetical protein